MADVKFEVVRVALPSGSSGSVDATIIGFGTPVAAICIATDGSTNGTVRDIARLSIGLTDFTRTWTVGFADAHGASTTESSRAQRTDSLVYIPLENAAGPVVQYTAAAITDGIRLTISGGTTGLTRLCTVVLIGGSDVTDAYVNYHDDLGSSTAPVAVTAPGFEPDVAFFTAAGLPTTPNATDPAGIFSYGCAVNKPTIQQGGVNFSAVDGVGVTKNNALVTNDAVLAQVYNDSAAWQAELTSFDANGFTLTPTASSGNDIFGYLCLKFANSPDFALVDVDVPASGDLDVDVGFEPDFALTALNYANTAARGTLDTTAVYAMHIAAQDASKVCVTGLHSQDAVSTSDTSSVAVDAFDFYGEDGSLDFEAPDPTFDSTGYITTPTNYPATAREAGWAFMIGPGGASPSFNPALAARVNNLL